jgi:hypothetical protein
MPNRRTSDSSGDEREAGGNMTFKHTYMVISTNFELEPLLDSYLETYPNGEFSAYQVVYKAQNERPDTPYSYIVVLERGQGNKPRFAEYLRAWCTVNRGKKAVAASLNHVFPDMKALQGQHLIGGDER